jgi:hypothetical protein
VGLLATRLALKGGALNMDVKEFNKISGELMDYCNEILIDRAGDYASFDRLHNFKQAGKLQGCRPEDALIGMMAKHVIALHDAIDYERQRPKDWWKEKIGDNINYLRLLWGLLNEKDSEYIKK